MTRKISLGDIFALTDKQKEAVRAADELYRAVSLIPDASPRVLVQIAAIRRHLACSISTSGIYLVKKQEAGHVDQ